MIRYLKNREIDRNRWDECVGAASCRRVYAFSWYLDTVCPGWDALVEDEYCAVMPVTHNSKWGIAYLFQPFFAQQLGIFSPELTDEGRTREFLAAIPSHYRLTEISLNEGNATPPGDGIFSVRPDYVLDLNQDYSLLEAGYAQNTRRNLKKAASFPELIHDNATPRELTDLFRTTFGEREGKLKPAHYLVMEQLVGTCLDHLDGSIRAIRSPEGSLQACAFFLHDRERRYFLFAASAPEARETGAMFMLVDRYIREQAGQPAALDFEGGSDPGVGRFYAGFGAQERHYPVVSVNRLPAVVKAGLKIARNLRKSAKRVNFV